MSTDTIKQRADAEAEEAEREEEAPEVEDEATPEPEPEPEPEQMSEKELNALGRKIDAENDRHEKRLRELYGPMFEDYNPCPLCMTEGYLLPLPLEAREPAQVTAVHAALGEAEAPDLLTADDVVLCEKCDGYGLVLTGSKREEHAMRNCNHCAGRGYTEKVATIPAYTPPPPPPAYGNGVQAHPPVYGEVDQWNRPAGHPHFGIAPELVT